MGMDNITSVAELQAQLADYKSKLNASLMGGQGLTRRIAAIRSAIELVEAQIASAQQE